LLQKRLDKLYIPRIRSDIRKEYGKMFVNSLNHYTVHRLSSFLLKYANDSFKMQLQNKIDEAHTHLLDLPQACDTSLNTLKEAIGWWGVFIQ
jgi:hypothetical protein